MARESTRHGEGHTRTAEAECSNACGPIARECMKGVRYKGETWDVGNMVHAGVRGGEHVRIACKQANHQPKGRSPIIQCALNRAKASLRAGGGPHTQTPREGDWG